MKRIVDLFTACGTDQRVMPPTQLYNEGWMLRLVLDWYSTYPNTSSPLSFHRDSRWYSEALLPTHFRARDRGDQKAESYTHADGVIGHFDILDGRGDVRLRESVTQFVVTEAKMFSGLSAGTKWAKTFDQAARNVACIAEFFHAANRSPDTIETLGFVVVAPESQINSGVFEDFVTKASILAKVQARVSDYNGEKDIWMQEWFLPTLNKIDLNVLSWESIICDISTQDTASGEELNVFLQTCLQFNRPRVLMGKGT